MNLVPEIPRPRPRRPIPTPRKNIKDMAKEYEENIILPPSEFRDGYKPVPLPRTKKQTLEIPRPRPRNGAYAKQVKVNEFLKEEKIESMFGEED